MSFDPRPYIPRLMATAKKYGVTLNLDNPETIQDKINWLNIYNCTALKTKCADKILIHDFCKERLGEDRCIPILATYKSVNDIKWDELPEQFVIKCNHGSGMNIVVKSKTNTDMGEVYEKLNKWMHQDFAFRNGIEAHYHEIPHRILVETFMDDGHEDLVDYKFMCCNGIPKMLQVTHNTHGNDHHMNYYDMSFNYLPIERIGHPSEPEKLDPKPSTFDEMVEMAKKLSSGFDFVRADFYEIKGRVYLGELTFTPGVGLFRYKDPQTSIDLGKMITLTKYPSSGHTEEVKTVVLKPKTEPTPSDVKPLSAPKSGVKKNFCVVHYNTPKLTEHLILSLNKVTKDAIIYVFDNSDKAPFTAKFDNVKVLDNTKGQIINFEKWLSNYPRRIMSPGKANNYGSAKHCYSIEKCMQIIGEPFVLLDSDILIKKDLTPLFDTSCIYVGQVVNQPNSDIKRVLPYVNFINVTMCKEKKIHYFNDSMMHGLKHTVKNPRADMYDTGASFYVDADKYPHALINVNDYIIHYKGGSWSAVSNRKLNRTLTTDEFLTVNKRFWSNVRNKSVVYTCITGGYDEIPLPDKITDGFDYICFSDDISKENPVWDFRHMPEELKGLSGVKQQRCVKICPHRYLPEYDFSIWIDGSVLIKDDLNNFMLTCCSGTSCVYIPEHPNRKCAYDEAIACERLRKDKKEIIDAQMERYRKEGFPSKFGLCQSNIMARYHNMKECIDMMETWRSELVSQSHRDQLSFNYAAWKHPETKITYLDKKMFDSKWFFWDKFHGKKSSVSPVKRIQSKPVPKPQLAKPAPKPQPAQQQVSKNAETAASQLENNPVMAERAPYQINESDTSPKKYRAMLKNTRKAIEGIPGFRYYY